MTEAEEIQLRELSAGLAAAEKSPWQPRAVAAAFARPAAGNFTLTMQGWIDLDHARSPFLAGGMPEAEDADAQIETGLRAFDYQNGSAEELSGAEAFVLAEGMRDACVAAFATALGMQPPDGGTAMDGDGFGDWLPVLACLVSQIGMRREDALACPVAQAFALIAGHRHNQGWRAGTANYRQQETLNDQPSTLNS